MPPPRIPTRLAIGWTERDWVLRAGWMLAKGLVALPGRKNRAHPMKDALRLVVCAVARRRRTLGGSDSRWFVGFEFTGGFATGTP